MSDYLEFRGRCRELAEAAVRADPTLTLTRGHYWCPLWGKQEHWWAVRPDGSIHDPSKAQFPSKGLGDYLPFDGFVECAECGKKLLEDEARYDSRYAFCSTLCHGRFVGVL